MIKQCTGITTAVAIIFILSCNSQKKTATQTLDPFHYTIQKTLTVKNGSVASAHPLASQVGVNIMKKGGNAFDAAIGTQLALAVVYPGAGNIGGGGFMVARLQNGQTISLDYRETAPQRAHRDMYLDASGNVIPDKSIRSVTASGVPGTVAGLFETLKYARLTLSELINPAIELAKNGFAITANEADALNGLKEDLQKYNRVKTAFQQNASWKPGDKLVQTELAATLERIRDKGRAGFYEGTTAEMIADEMRNGSGYVDLNDLKTYQAKWRDPHRFSYKGYEVVSMGPPSSGGILLHQMLVMIEKNPIVKYENSSPDAVQLMTEVERRAYADRAQFMGDADYFKVPVESLTNEKYLEERMKDYVPGKAGKSTIDQYGQIPAKESKETTHISIIDKDGNAVAITTTLNDSYGSRVVVKGAGFLLNNEMDDFSIKPGQPNLYGAIGGEANAIAPGKRMLSSMSPTILSKDGRPFLVVGTPGGTTIPTSVFQTILDVVDYKMSTVDVVNIPKFHHQWFPDIITVENGVPEATIIELQNMGYKIERVNSIGRTEVIKILPDGSFEVVADRRGDDSAAGY